MNLSKLGPALLIGGVVAVVCAIVLFLAGCPPLDPSKVPPCTGHEVYPDPCAAAARDGGAR